MDEVTYWTGVLYGLRIARGRSPEEIEELVKQALERLEMALSEKTGFPLLTLPPQNP